MLLDGYKHISLNVALYLKENSSYNFLSGSYKDSYTFKGQMPVSCLVSGQYVFSGKYERQKGYLKWVPPFDFQL